MGQERSRGLNRVGVLLTAVLVGFAALVAPAAVAAAAPVVEDGDSVYVGSVDWVSGSAFTFPIYVETPADPSNPGEPDFWAYCIEQEMSYEQNREAVVGELNSFLGANYFDDPEVQGKVLWVLAHGYPALSVEALAAAAGVPGLTRDDAISATQTAIWRYTELTFDAAWHWVSDEAEAAYWYLVNSANASTGMAPEDFETVVSISAPVGAQTAGSLVGPFVVNSNQPTVSVSVEPAIPLTDESGTPIDPAAVIDGQEIYLDLTDETAAGAATVTASAVGSSATGLVLLVPTTPGGTPTAGDHAQSLILVAPSTATTDAAAEVSWDPSSRAVPVIGTTLTDDADGDHVLAWDGGTVTDAVAYQDLTPGVEYTLEGELMRQSDGSATGITGSVTFTPGSTDGTVHVQFTVPLGFAGEVLVAFEWLFEAGVDDPVAEHTDIDDPAQTVTVEDEPVLAADPASGPGVLLDTGYEPPAAVLVSAALAVLLGTATLFIRNRRRPSSSPASRGRCEGGRRAVPRS